MTTLEDLLKQSAERGLTHMSLWFAEGRWSAIAAPSTGHHYVSSFDKNPVAAVVDCLTKLPKAPRRAGKITATVKDVDNAAAVLLEQLGNSEHHPEGEQ